MGFGPNESRMPNSSGPDRSSAAALRGGTGVAVMAVAAGLLGCVLPLLPLHLAGVRQYLALGFGLVAFTLATVAYTSNRPGKPIALAGVVLAALALMLGVLMLAGTLRT